VKITKDGHFVIDGENTEKDGLLNMLQIQLEKEKNKQSKAMAIDADDEARHEDVVSVIDAAAAAKVQNITFVAHKKFGEKAP
jgi:biopolymer transport protein ExbD